MMQWAYFPRSAKPTDIVLKVVAAFDESYASIDSAKQTGNSNSVLKAVTSGLEDIGFTVESG